MPDVIASSVVSLVALGMAAAFYGADRESPISRVLALGLAAMGVSYGLGVPVADMEQQLGRGFYLTGLLGLVEAVSLVAFTEWLVRVRHTVPAGDLDTRLGDTTLRLVQGLSVLYGLLGLLLPGVKQRDFYNGLENADALTRPGFWLFAVTPIGVLAGCALGLGLLLRRRLDKAERMRVLGALLAGPFLMAGMVLPLSAGSVAIALGEMIFLVGAVKYHVLQGRRGEFMARFLSPQVAQLVRQQGLDSAIEQRQLEISVVCCDLRGFTAYAQGHPSRQVIELLREYYDLAGEAAAEFGATIKDFAGDGVLLLVGAPIEQADHAARSLELARRLREAAGALARRWSDARGRIGVGVGVASGVVTVGVINSTSRLEYAAVGAAVNLASRLCEMAQDGEILADEHTIRLAAATDFRRNEPVAVHGFAAPVELFASRA
ncbi:MAG: adenylate/guanylate cyclase domain-containing protein [Nevskia sp.]|nr:adenylate/guanylate cyclase domain-containing protein [Nevskia sp.]